MERRIGSEMRRLLFICHRVPYPPDKGERIRAFHEIRILSSHFRITLAALAHNPEDSQAAQGLEPWCESVFLARVGGLLGLGRGLWALLRGKSATEGYFRSRAMLKALPALAGEGPFDLALGYCSSTLPYLLASPARARVMDLVDVDSAKWAAYAQESGWPKAWLYRREAAAVSALEQAAVNRCDAVLAVSPAEVALLGEVAGRVLPVGIGVDTEYYKPPDPPIQPQTPCLVFTGQMDYRPNVEGVTWFVREVWPRLRCRQPDLEFKIVGRNPAPEVRRLARETGVTVTGSVPDVRPYLAEAAAAVCPLRIARGIQNKILEAMAMARPVVASPAALAGLDLQVGREVLLADGPEQWETQIAALLADQATADALGRSARQCVVERFGWQARLAPLVTLCRRLAEEHPLPGNSMAARGQMPAQARTSSSPRDVEAPVR
jgi:sugar transferase (PEP-CTERM/EpsH1 system associated)